MKWFTVPPVKNFTEQNITKAFIRADHIIRFYYIVLFYFALNFGLLRWLRFLNVTEIDPLWPASWIRFFDMPIAVSVIFSTFLLGALLSAIFPHNRLARILAFLGLFVFVAFTNSFGKINHSFHVWLLTSFIFIFLPSKSEKISSLSLYYQKFLLVFWGSQAITLLIYSMAGIAKIYMAFVQMGRGEVHVFHPQALSLQIANRLLQTGSTSLLGPWLIEHELIGWALYVTTIYLEFFAFLIAFRPSLHKLWACGIILTHVGIYLAIPAPFFENVLLLALLFFLSPFSLHKLSWKDSVVDLPLVGFLVRRLSYFEARSNN